MPYTFSILPANLHQAAEVAATSFRTTYGINSFKVEEAISSDLRYVPTLHEETTDHHVVCLEVSESAYPVTISPVVADSMRLGLPILLYVVLPKGSDSDFEGNLRRAKEHGIGVLIVDGGHCSEVTHPLSLSLTSVRACDLRALPSKYRQAMSEAHRTFLNGNPAKGCAEVYDLVEALSRSIAKKIDKKSLWTQAQQAYAQTMKFDKVAWAVLGDLMLDGINHNGTGCPNLNRDLLARVRGLAGRRNQSGHRPSNRKLLIKRDRELRTRFEEATDVFCDLVEAVKPLRL